MQDTKSEIDAWLVQFHVSWDMSLCCWAGSLRCFAGFVVLILEVKQTKKKCMGNSPKNTVSHLRRRLSYSATLLWETWILQL